MKKLLIIRHAKAAHETESGDFARPLKHSGEKDAKHLAKKLEKKEIVPDKIYSSDALRAKTTAEIIADKLELAAPELIHDVYEASQETLARIVSNFPDGYNFLALAGHNPGLSYLLTYLTGQYCNLDTSGAALIELDIHSWQMAASDTGKLSWYYEAED
ncbi:SixA phosphatase family protein [Mucilaginibacter sp. KACC 22063]|uniref:SixA phosphatase family protein n=1 Tax=Mucilaginibacter sp. KACC 22063 TaxID=3025666 RepID=UPI00236707C9|nr:histidine phosphatase family protein [Mucilaginibacter sp. KACC 22063]WDF54108.1 histidine phosphatase family protein [Mucilaginibacter sp. KACC 22063]